MVISFIGSWDQQIHVWAAALGWPMEAVLRLVLAGIAGGLVGLEREVRGRQAGFRTNLLVCLGSALVMIVSTQFARFPWQPTAGINLNIDPARIAYGVMTGVGFLGAGAIVHNKGSVRRLTTAAGLWCVAAVGLAVGFGLYLLSAMACILILMALWFLDYLEEMIPKLRYSTITLRTKYRPGCVAEAVATITAGGLEVMDASFERSADLSHADIHLRVVFFNSDLYYNLERRLEGDENYHLLSTREL